MEKNSKLKEEQIIIRGNMGHIKKANKFNHQVMWTDQPLNQGQFRKGYRKNQKSVWLASVWYCIVKGSLPNGPLDPQLDQRISLPLNRSIYQQKQDCKVLLLIFIFIYSRSGEKYTSIYSLTKQHETKTRDLSQALTLYTEAVRNGDVSKILHLFFTNVDTHEAIKFLQVMKKSYTGDMIKYERLIDNLNLQVNPTGRHELQAKMTLTGDIYSIREKSKCDGNLYNPNMELKIPDFRKPKGLELS